MHLLGFFVTVMLVCAANSPAATLTLFAGTGSKTTGPAAQCRLADPFAIDFDSHGNAYICEMTNNRIVKVDAGGNLSVFAGTTHKGSSGDGGPASAAEFNAAHHLLVDGDGNLLVADSWNWKIRRIDTKTGVITTFAGTGVKGDSGDGGPASEARFSGIYSLSLDATRENVYLADLENRKVKAINLKTQIVRTIAGTGQRGIPVDGSEAAKSPLLDPRAVAVAKNGNVYILERGGNALRVVDPAGKIRTVVGTGKAGAYTDASDPLAVTLKGPKHLCMDKQDNVLLVDSDNDVIRRYVPRENAMSRVAGTGVRGIALTADPLQTQLHHPHGVNVDSRGRIYICDSYNGRVLRVE